MIPTNCRSKFGQSKPRRYCQDPLNLIDQTVRGVVTLWHVPKPPVFPIEPFKLWPSSGGGFSECVADRPAEYLLRFVSKTTHIHASTRLHNALRQCGHLIYALGCTGFHKTVLATSNYCLKWRLFSEYFGS